MPPIDHSRNRQDFTAEGFVNGRVVDEGAAFAPGSLDDLILRQQRLLERIANRIEQDRRVVNAKYTVVAEENKILEKVDAQLQRRRATLDARERNVEDREISAEWTRRVLQ
jgi:2C-methyl-D-erythritol 2,4-cyclodiphosphate synthase